MKKYLAIYDRKEVEIQGEGLSLYQAKLKAIEKLHVPRSKEHMVSIALTEKNGAPVIHAPMF